jgi:predicted tellurium resistance membrane protein TerC
MNSVAALMTSQNAAGILGLTKDRFLVYSSNMLAVLGLRSLYVLLADALHRVKHLQTGLGLVLAFVGLKMMYGARRDNEFFYHCPSLWRADRAWVGACSGRVDDGAW